MGKLLQKKFPLDPCQNFLARALCISAGVWFLLLSKAVSRTHRASLGGLNLNFKIDMFSGGI